MSRIHSSLFENHAFILYAITRRHGSSFVISISHDFYLKELGSFCRGKKK